MNSLIPVEHNNQRVLTTAQIAEGYGTDQKVISNNFNRNKERYQPGRHYYCLEGEDLRVFRANPQIDELPENLNRLYLWTERGALLHAKSLGTDEAWAMYEELSETYFKAKEMVAHLDSLSPELRLLIQLETGLGQQKKELLAVNRRVDDMCDVIKQDTATWREDAKHLIAKVANKLGGSENIRELNSEIYRLVEQRAGVSLAVRLTNMKRRLADEGICRTKRDEKNRVDVIGADKKLIEIYFAIVKELAVKHGVAARAG